MSFPLSFITQAKGEREGPRRGATGKSLTGGLALSPTQPSVFPKTFPSILVTILVCPCTLHKLHSNPTERTPARGSLGCFPTAGPGTSLPFETMSKTRRETSIASRHIHSRSHQGLFSPRIWTSHPHSLLSRGGRLVRTTRANNTLQGGYLRDVTIQISSAARGRSANPFRILMRSSGDLLLKEKLNEARTTKNGSAANSPSQCSKCNLRRVAIDSSALQEKRVRKARLYEGVAPYHFYKPTPTPARQHAQVEPHFWSSNGSGTEPAKKYGCTLERY